MASDNSKTDDELELEGAVSELAVNNELPIPDGEQERAREHIREFVEREREWLETQPRFEPDLELLERQEEFREQMAERLAEELGLLQEYEELREQEHESRGDGSGATEADGAGREGT